MTGFSQKARRKRQPYRKRADRSATAFTLVELLLVVAIISITTLVAMPSLVKSIRGNRLRAASRTVVMSGKYARSMALLLQQPVALTLDLDAAALRVDLHGGGPSPAAESAGGAETGTVLRFLTSPPSEPGSGEAMVAEPPPPAVAPERVALRRELDAIEIDAVEVREAEDRTFGEGRAVIVYQPNGRCPRYEVVLRDEHDATIRIEVDELSTATTTRE